MIPVAQSFETSINVYNTGSEQEKVECAEILLTLFDPSFQTLKDSVLDHGVAYQNKSGHDTAPEAEEATFLVNLQGSFFHADLLFCFFTVGVLDKQLCLV